MQSTPRNQSWFKATLEQYCRSCTPIIHVATVEEERALRLIAEVANALQRPAWLFGLAEGMTSLVGTNGTAAGAKDPLTALEHFEKASDGALYVLKDAQGWWDNPLLQRKLRDVATRSKYSRRRLIITSPASAKLPRELSDLTEELELPRPGLQELSAVLDHLAQTPGVTINLSPPERQQLLQAALGLTASQAQFVFGMALVQGGVLHKEAIKYVAQEKARVIAQNKALKVCDVDRGLDSIGGLDLLKDWLLRRKNDFTDEARAFGLPYPKGVALMGIPGTGKSLAATAIAAAWNLPLARLDIGALFNSLVSESEANLRSALGQLNAMAPCVAMVDEFEKAFANGGIDGGTSKRMFGSLLSWMQDKTEPVFLVATCNDVSQLPPEVLRKGRFDEVFFLDLPTFKERVEIWTVQIRAFKRDPSHFDLNTLAASSQDYTGAEIEQAIKEGLHAAFADKPRNLTNDDLLTALGNMRPLSQSRPEAIERLRQWVKEERARPASSPDSSGGASSGLPIDIRTE
jgi:AAA+ superfamily predicted ATPase